MQDNIIERLNDIENNQRDNHHQIIVLFNDMKEEIKEIKEEIIEMKEEIKEMKEEINTLKVEIKEIDINGRILSAKFANSSIGRDEEIQLVPLPDGTLPLRDLYPISIQVLLVAGNEKAPGGGDNNWNADKSEKLLHHYSQDVPPGSPSRDLRLMVAKCIGVTRTQLNWAQLSL